MRNTAQMHADEHAHVRVIDSRVLADDWGVLRRNEIELRTADGTWTRQPRETYDRGNGAAILLYEPDQGTVLLVRQFRYPAFVNGHPDGMLLEVPAGLLDGDDPRRRSAGRPRRRPACGSGTSSACSSCS
jgi:hypothetical protein